MIDLHLHTVFSDGSIVDIKKITQFCDIISITDHNTLRGFQYFNKYAHDKKVIMGCEVTVDKDPDYLVYFLNTKDYYSIEKQLEKIRLTEEDVIKKCYNSLGYNQWERDLKCAFPPGQKIKNARTRDLAAIIHLYKNGMKYDNGYFDMDDLKVARLQRSLYFENYGRIFPNNYAFVIAKMYKCKIVLAHPIHTASKRSKSLIFDVDTVIQELELLIQQFIEQGGKFLEWEYFSIKDSLKYGFNLDELKKIRNVIIKHAERNNLQYTIGSDSHSLDDYEEVLKWLPICDKRIKSNIASWITQ